MTVEIVLATVLSVIAISIAAIFYNKEKSEREETNEIIKDARDVINKIKPTIEEQQQRFDVETKKKEIRRDNTIDEIRFWIMQEKQFLFSIKDIFENERILTDAVERLQAVRNNPTHIEKQLSYIMENNRD